MAVHQLTNTHSWQKKQQEEANRRQIMKYPGAVRAQIDKLMHELNRNEDWLGDTSTEIILMKRFSWPVNLSHAGIRALRRKGLQVCCVGGFNLSSDSINKIFEKYSQPGFLREEL